MERLQKVLAAAGLGSRRQCEEFILQGRVTVDKKTIRELGCKVDLERQEICCDGESIRPERKCYYLFNKPRGVLCTNSDMEGPRVLDYFKGISHRLFTVGRLDKDSEGLILVTNDGEFSQKLSHPSSEMTRIYRVKARGYVTRETISDLSKGAWFSIGKVVPHRMRLVRAEKTFSEIEIYLREGKNREIRRIFAIKGHPVKRLTRIQYGPFKLGDLKPGYYHKITRETIDKMLAENNR